MMAMVCLEASRMTGEGEEEGRKERDVKGKDCA